MGRQSKPKILSFIRCFLRNIIYKSRNNIGIKTKVFQKLDKRCLIFFLKFEKNHHQLELRGNGNRCQPNLIVGNVKTRTSSMKT